MYDIVHKKFSRAKNTLNIAKLLENGKIAIADKKLENQQKIIEFPFSIRACMALDTK